jgi:transposase
MSTLSIAHYFPFSQMVVTRQSVSGDATMAVVVLKPDERLHPVCHACRTPGHGVHSKETRPIRDLNFAAAQVTLNCTYRKLFCHACGRVMVEDTGVFDACSRVTRRLARFVHDLCKVMTVSDVAAHLGLDWKTVKNIDKAFLEKEYGTPDYSGLRILAVDEFSVKKGHRYMTVVLNYDTGAVVWMGEGNEKATLLKFYALLTPEQRASIEAVAMDMWKGFIEATKDALPNAAIVFDLFHLVSSFGKIIDQVRITEFNKALAKNRPVFKGAKYLLLKNRRNLRKRNERVQLKELLALNRAINIIYILKDKLKHIWSYTSRTWAAKALREWIALARTMRHHAVNAFCRTLKTHAYGILNHCDFAIHTSVLEGVNNKIKVIKRKAYGFHDLDYFALKVMQAFDPKNVQLYGR